VVPEAASCVSSLASSVLSSAGSYFGIGGSTKHTRSKRQELPAWLDNLLPKVSVFVGGGGSVGSGGPFAVPNSVSAVRSGAYISPKDTFQFSSENVNYDPVEKEIYLTLDFEWVPGKVEKLRDVGMGSIALDCGTFAFQPPKDKPVTY
jgi:hypothetical protein